MRPYDLAKSIFLSALELPPAERAAFVREECTGDDTLLADVESLLAHHDATLAGLDVVAEGVEHPAQLAFLRAQGCIAYQGYLATPPLPLPDFESWLGKHVQAAQPGTVPPSAGAAP